MGNDLPDYQFSVSTGALEASSLTNGADAAKPASPAVGDIYLATDTGILYYCKAAGAWTNIGILYLLLAGGTMGGAIAMGTHKITGLAAPAADADAARKLDVDTVDAKLDDVSVAQPARVIDTEYQNTSGKLLLVTVVIACTSAEAASLDIGAASPPGTTVARSSAGTLSSGTDRSTVMAIVPPSYYYKVVTVNGTPAIAEWTEYTLF